MVTFFVYSVFILFGLLILWYCLVCLNVIVKFFVGIVQGIQEARKKQDENSG